MADLLPMTVGLLASAMMRRNHAVFMPGDFSPIMMIEAPEVRIPKEMDAVIEMRVLAEADLLDDVQIMEEFTGTGFYRPDLEDSYKGRLREFGMEAAAEARLAGLG